LQVEKFYSKQFSDKEEGLRLLKEELRALVSGDSNLDQQHNSPNKIARAAIFLLHRALRDKVYAVYSLAAEAIRLFFTEFVPARYTQDFSLLHCCEQTLPGCDKINLKY
jgi:centrosomal protein CEP104